MFLALFVLFPQSGESKQRLVTSRLAFKRLSLQEKDEYLALNEWRGKAGGYANPGHGRKIYSIAPRLL